MLPRRPRIKPAIAKRGREVKTLQQPRLGACTVKWKRLYLEYAPSRFRPNFAHSWTRNMSHFQYGASWHGRRRVHEILVTCLDDTKNINHMIGVFGLCRFPKASYRNLRYDAVWHSLLALHSKSCNILLFRNVLSNIRKLYHITY